MHLTLEEQKYIKENVVNTQENLIEKYNEYLRVWGFTFGTPAVKQQFERQFYKAAQQAVAAHTPKQPPKETFDEEKQIQEE